MSLVCRGSDLRRKLFPETLVWELNLFLFNHRTTCCWLIPFKVLFTLVRTKRWHLLDMTSDFFPLYLNNSADGWNEAESTLLQWRLFSPLRHKNRRINELQGKNSDGEA